MVIHPALREAGYVLDAKIQDYSDVALLLYSVRAGASECYIHALERRAVPVYCPRSRIFFEQAEILLMFGSLAHLLHVPKASAGSFEEEHSFAEYLARCQGEATAFCQKYPSFARELQQLDQMLQRACEKDGRLEGRLLARCFSRLLLSAQESP